MVVDAITVFGESVIVVESIGVDESTRVGESTAGIYGKVAVIVQCNTKINFQSFSRINCQIRYITGV